MSSLPEEIIEDNILTRLPVKSIARFRCVSKSWRLLFQNPNFIRKHLNHANLMNNFNILVTNRVATHDILTETCLYSVDYPFVGHAFKLDLPFMSTRLMLQFLGSCNGLVCIEPSPHDIFIWNPATRECKRLTKAPIENPSAEAKGGFYRILDGFGFDCKNDDYKVLRIVSFLENEQVSEARVYSLASNSWKELGLLPYLLPPINIDQILLNGGLHWFATVHRNGLKSTVVVCYDFSDETFRDVPLPNNISNEEYLFMLDLGIWEGKLCILHRHQNDHIDVWTMMDNKWIKHLKITAHVTDLSYQRPIQTLHSGEVLFQAGLIRREGAIGLRAYNPNLDIARALKIHGLPDESNYLVNQTYVETLVPLNSDTYVGQ